jgi:hypothetical protein
MVTDRTHNTSLIKIDDYTQVLREHLFEGILKAVDRSCPHVPKILTEETHSREADKGWPAQIIQTVYSFGYCCRVAALARGSHPEILCSHVLALFLPGHPDCVESTFV